MTSIRSMATGQEIGETDGSTIASIVCSRLTLKLRRPHGSRSSCGAWRLVWYEIKRVDMTAGPAVII